MRRYKLEDKEFSEINITPLTDVILVVLIIFMITSPLLITGALKVKLPQASSSNTTVNNDIQVNLNSKDQIYLDDKIVTLTDLASDLQAEFVQKKDKDAVYGDVVQLLDATKNAGANKLLIATLKK